MFRKYFLQILTLVCGVLLVSGGVNRYFSYQQNKLALGNLQHDKAAAAAAAAAIRQSILQVGQQLDVTELLKQNPGSSELVRMEFHRLMARLPAVDELVELDANGRELLSVLRRGTDPARPAKDYDRFAQYAQFMEAKPGQNWYGPVVFRNDSEPFMAVAVRCGGENCFLMVAEVNLKSVWNIALESIRLGGAGKAYMVDRSGHIVAATGTGGALEKPDVAGLNQVRAALAETPPLKELAMIARNQNGEEVLASFASVDPLGWFVFVEQAVDQINPPLNITVFGSAALMLAGLLISALTALWFARGLARPIRILQEGTQRIGAGELDLKIEVHSGDELESLADQFNDMTGRLRESYADLERKVEERTREIQEKSHQLEIADKHKSEFLASMSHELRTPLNAIIGFSDLLLAKMFGDVNAKQFEYLQFIHSSGQHLLSLINDILDLAKVEAGRMELDLGTFDLHNAIDAALTLVRERAMNHGITLSSSVDSQLGLINADERKLKQILLNLLSNAVKFTPAGGKIEVGARKIDQMVEIAVSDTGIGIDLKDQAEVFEEFKQIGSDYTRKAEGTGLGLALTRKFVELHGGAISLESAPGKGSTFAFTIPLNTAAPEVPAATS